MKQKLISTSKIIRTTSSFFTIKWESSSNLIPFGCQNLPLFLLPSHKQDLRGQWFWVEELLPPHEIPCENTFVVQSSNFLWGIALTFQRDLSPILPSLVVCNRNKRPRC